MKKILMFLFLFNVHFLFTQTYDQKERLAIKSLAGCYDVTFQFAETFASDSSYKFHERHKSSARELIVVEEETHNKIVLQHILILDDGEVMKHWREDWVYENTDGFTYAGDFQWNHFLQEESLRKGKWTQKVLQVDDSPRYEGSAAWLFTDGEITWSSSCYAPLPRREYTTRSDYKVLKRKNTYRLTDFGYVHEEDNVKFIINNSGDTNFVMEKGFNVYKRINDNYSENAVKWWKDNRNFWLEVRNVWTDIFDQKTDLKLHQKVNGKTLFGELLSLGNKYSNGSSGSLPGKNDDIKNLINKYIKSEN